MQLDRGETIFLHNARYVSCLLAFWVVAIGNVISGSFIESFCASNGISFAIVFLRALEGVLFFDFGPTAMAFIEGGPNAQSEPGDMDPSAVSSTVVASSSAHGNRTTAGGGACTFMSKLVWLCARRISPLWVSEGTRVLERVRSATFGPLARLSLPLCDPSCFVDGL